MDELKRRLSSWMEGRYGIDELGRVLLIACALCWFINIFANTVFLHVLAIAFFVLCLWRSFSRDYSKRSNENNRFLQSIEKPQQACNHALARWRNRKTTLYFRCDGCKRWLSVPKGKGKLRVVCPDCKKEMFKKS